MNCDPSKKKQRNTGNQKVVSAKPGKMWLTTSKQNHQIYQNQEPLTQNANKQNCIFRNCLPTTSNANSASNLHNHAFFQSHRIIPCFFSVVSGKLPYIMNHYSTYTTEPQPYNDETVLAKSVMSTQSPKRGYEPTGTSEQVE